MEGFQDRPRMAVDRTLAHPAPQLFHTRTWFGQRRVTFVHNKRRYSFRSVEAAVRAYRRLVRRQPSYTGWIVSLAVLIVLLSGMWIVSRSPQLLLSSVDAARSVLGPGPVAFVESQVFRAATLVREVRVRLGDTGPRWHVEGAVVPTPAPHKATPTPTPTTQPTAEPTDAPERPSPTSVPTTKTVMRGGNIRSEPVIDEKNVLGWVMPGDKLEVLVGDEAQAWLQVRLVEAGNMPNDRPVERGSVGWISAQLLMEQLAQSTSTATRPSATPIPAPTARLLFAPTAIPPKPIASPTPVPPVKVEIPTLQPEQAPPRFDADWSLMPIPVAINDGQLANEGQWQLLPAAADTGSPAMAVTAFRPDPTRPDIQAAVVAVDMARAQLHMVAGMLEPQAEITPTVSLPREGRIPNDMYGGLLAAFNGGFKSLHGNDGMGVGSITYRQPVAGRATIAVLADGSVRVGLWGRDFGQDSGLQAWRQNGHLLVENGQVTAKALEGGPGWGASVDKQVETWRSGVGVSADGRTLLYAVGDALTSARLAEVLHAAGAANALQLDINNYWVRFVTFQRNEQGQLVSQPLISAMPQDRKKYLGTEERDFMYLTLR